MSKDSANRGLSETMIFGKRTLDEKPIVVALMKFNGEVRKAGGFVKAVVFDERGYERVLIENDVFPLPKDYSVKEFKDHPDRKFKGTMYGVEVWKDEDRCKGEVSGDWLMKPMRCEFNAGHSGKCQTDFGGMKVQWK